MHVNASSVAQGQQQQTGASSSPLATTAKFEPFVQIASWGEGEFYPLMSVTSTELSLEGEHPAREDRRNNGDAINSRAIRTREGDLEIAPAAGEKNSRRRQILNFLARRGDKVQYCQPRCNFVLRVQ